MSPRKKKLPDIQVIIPYEKLYELLCASAMIGDLLEENRKLRTELSALRYQFTELIEKFREYQD